MTAARFNGDASSALKEEAERLRAQFRNGHFGLNPDVEEIVIKGKHWLRYPDGSWRDAQGKDGFDPRNLFRLPDTRNYPQTAKAASDHQHSAAPLGLRKFPAAAAVIGAVDGGGKGAQAVMIALSFITGRELLGEKVWRTGPVAIVTYEDDQDEWCRRIASACLDHGIDYESVLPSFHFITRSDDERVRFAEHTIRGGGISFPDGDGIIDALKAIGAVLLIVDPFNHAHMLEDGNNNVMVAQTAQEISRICKRSGAAGLVLHHLRKGSTGTADDLMGAVMLRATFRSARIMQGMTPEQAEDLDVPAEEAFRYSRIAGSKENYAPPPDRCHWYKLKSHDLGNPAGIYVDGDNVQAFVHWVPPDPFKDLGKTKILEVVNKLRQGPRAGEHYSPEANSNDWAAPVIASILGKTTAAAERMLKTWIKNELLIQDKYSSAKRGKYVWGITVNESKARDILASFYEPPPAPAAAEVPDTKAETKPKAEAASKAMPGPKLPAGEKIALDALHATLTGQGVEAISVEEWRAAAIANGLQAAFDDPERAFDQARRQLIKKTIVTAQGEKVLRHPVFGRHFYDQ